MTIDDSRTEILTDARAKRESALRFARTGNPRDEEYWLGIAARMTAWIEQLERDLDRAEPFWSRHFIVQGRPAIDLPPTARRSRPIQTKPELKL